MHYYLLAYKATNLAQDSFIEGVLFFKEKQKQNIRTIIESSSHILFNNLRNFTGRDDDSAIEHVKMFKDLVPVHQSYSATYSDSADQYDVSISFGEIRRSFPFLAIIGSREASTLEDTVNRLGLVTLEHAEHVPLVYGLAVTGLSDTLLSIDNHISASIESPEIFITLSCENEIGTIDQSSCIFLN